MRGCTNQPFMGEKCIPIPAVGVTQSVDVASSNGRQTQQPSKRCVWTCRWNGCNNKPLSTATALHHQLHSAVSLVIAVVVATVLTAGINV